MCLFINADCSTFTAVAFLQDVPSLQVFTIEAHIWMFSSPYTTCIYVYCLFTKTCFVHNTNTCTKLKQITTSVTLRRIIPVVFIKLHISNMSRYTVRTQLCYIMRYCTTYQLHVLAITWPSSGCTK
jgi:3-dehydroquinate dehydratase